MLVLIIICALHSLWSLKLHKNGKKTTVLKIGQICDDVTLEP